MILISNTITITSNRTQNSRISITIIVTKNSWHFDYDYRDQSTRNASIGRRRQKTSPRLSGGRGAIKSDELWQGGGASSTEFEICCFTNIFEGCRRKKVVLFSFFLHDNIGCNSQKLFFSLVVTIFVAVKRGITGNF